MLALLLEERPGDVRIAWDDIRARGRGWVKRVKAGASSLERLEPPEGRKLLSFLEETG
jgi:hypothetical protein